MANNLKLISCTIALIGLLLSVVVWANGAFTHTETSLRSHVEYRIEQEKENAKELFAPKYEMSRITEALRQQEKQISGIDVKIDYIIEKIHD